MLYANNAILRIKIVNTVTVIVALLFIIVLIAEFAYSVYYGFYLLDDPFWQILLS